MINITEETLIPIAEIAKLLPGRPHIGTVVRWGKKGMKDGRQLELVKLGGRLFSTRRAVEEFVASGSKPAKIVTSTPVPAARQERVEVELDKAGF